jgi:2,3-diketo-5-methylthio-1-phosphopentane phosphatase
LAKLVVLSDFDGTVVNVDTGVVALSKFAKGDWETLEERYAAGEIKFEVSLEQQYSMIAASEQDILKEIDSVAVVRSYFTDVVKYCKTVSIPFIITSGGLDFIIRHVLARNNLTDYVRVCAPRALCHQQGMRVTFPRRYDSNSSSFKDDLVGHYQEQGYIVAYIGDGHSDYFAIKKADMPFAMKDSPSARRCKTDGIRFTEITDFRPVLDTLKELRS